jgi:PAS domain S-box-containing protein
MPSPKEGQGPLPAGLVLLVVCLVAVILIAGMLFYQAQEQQIQDNVTTELSSIALLKVEQIASWRDERLGDAVVLSQNPILSDGIKQYLASPDPAKQQKILTLFRQINTSYHYRNVMLVDPEGFVKVTLDPSDTTINPTLSKLVAESFATNNPTLTDLTVGTSSRSPQMYAIAPLLVTDNGRTSVVGAVILTIDPAMDLYPVIQSWPVPSKSAETLLVEREGDHVLYLNELRHQQNTALNLTIPLSRTDLPAVMAVLGTTGAFTGRDYRGVDVISVLNPVPGSPWFIVAKIDTEEAYSAKGNRAALIIALVAGTLVGSIIIVGLLWQRRQKYHYRTLYAAETARREEEQRNRERMEVLLQLPSMESATEQELADFVLDAGCRLTGSTLAFIGVMSRDESVFDITAWSKSAMKDCSVAASPFHFPIEKAGIWAEAVRQRKPLIVNDYPVPRPGKKGLPPGYVPITRFASVPIIEGDRIVMVCAVANKEAEYTDTDVDNLTLLMQGVWNHLRKRKADEEIKSAKAFLDRVIDLSPLPMWISDNEGTVTRVNRSLCETIHLIPDEIVGKYNVLKDVNLENQGVMPDVKAVFQKQIPARFSILWRAADAGDVDFRGARDMYIDVSLFPILNARGELVNIVCQWVDFTERKMAEIALRESEEKYRTLVLSADTGIILQSASGKILTWNPAAERVFGITADEVLGHLSTDNKWESVREDSAPFPASEHPSMITLSTGIPLRNVIMGITSSMGSFSWITINTTPLMKQGESTPYAVVISFQDITERKHAEEVLNEQERSYRTLAENLLGIVYRVHVREDGRMQFFNAMVTVMTGYTPEELVRGEICSIDPLILPEDRERVITEVDAAIRENRPFRIEYRLTHKDGSLRSFVDRGQPVFDNAGLVCIDGIILDITESKRAEEQCGRLMNELARKNAELDRFTYTVSHDLKSPLITIRSYLSLLENDLESGDSVRVKTDIAWISEAAEKLESLITTLLALSRSGRAVDIPVQVPFTDLAREAARLLDAPLRDRSVTLVIPDNLPEVSGDPCRLLQVMTNLIDNAVKFMGDQDEPRVEIGVRDNDGIPVFFIMDNGMGFNKENLPKVFGLYERFNPDIPGSGIGLATVKRIIEAHGGKIWVESEGVGKGVTFRFTLPSADRNPGPCA